MASPYRLHLSTAPSRKRREKATPCSGCEGKAVDGKQLCTDCLQKIATSSSAISSQSPDILAWIRNEVAQGISATMEVRNWVEKRPRQRLDSSNLSDSDVLEPSGEFEILDQVDYCESESEMLSESLDYKSVDKLILMAKLYPLEEETSRMWITPPKVDAPISRVARNVMLPFDSSASLREPIDRKLDINLSKIYTAAGAGCHPAVALTAVSRSMKSWLRELDSDVERGVKRQDLCDTI
ncbi:Hypothetical predicted protein [Pelobates cultripes]|uniref:Uncharacterized protein n=1 Tax=Pelobates cultripes TaxID=61616 RepID=A0AAD1R160_PELCU|nr:Hypothetical predicted protein [Pelobates cultripes]